MNVVANFLKTFFSIPKKNFSTVFHPTCPTFSSHILNFETKYILFYEEVFIKHFQSLI